MPAGQVHDPCTHVVPWAQAWPQDPQLAGSVPVSTQALPQAVVPGAVQEHLPPAQVSAAEQAVVQLPQWSWSVWGSTQAVPQLVSPTAQAARQVPFEHASPEAQAFPQAPQLAASVSRLVQAPLHDVVFPPQPTSAPTQTPLVQVVPVGQSALDWQRMVTLVPQLGATSATRMLISAKQAAARRRRPPVDEARRRDG